MKCHVQWKCIKCWNSVLDYRARFTNCLISEPCMSIPPWPVSTMKHGDGRIMCFIMVASLTNAFQSLDFFFLYPNSDWLNFWIPDYLISHLALSNIRTSNHTHLFVITSSLHIHTMHTINLCSLQSIIPSASLMTLPSLYYWVHSVLVWTVLFNDFDSLTFLLINLHLHPNPCPYLTASEWFYYLEDLKWQKRFFFANS